MNLGFPEMIFIFVIALIIFGPKKLPEIGRQIGRFMGEFRRASNEFKWQLENEMRQLETEDKQKKGDLPKWDSPVNTVSYTPGSELVDVPDAHLADDVKILPPSSTEPEHAAFADPGHESWASPAPIAEAKPTKITDA